MSNVYLNENDLQSFLTQMETLDTKLFSTLSSFSKLLKSLAEDGFVSGKVHSRLAQIQFYAEDTFTRFSGSCFKSAKPILEKYISSVEKSDTIMIGPRIGISQVHDYSEDTVSSNSSVFSDCNGLATELQNTTITYDCSSSKVQEYITLVNQEAAGYVSDIGGLMEKYSSKYQSISEEITITDSDTAKGLTQAISNLNFVYSILSRLFALIATPSVLFSSDGLFNEQLSAIVGDREAAMYYFKDYVTGYNPDTDTYEYNWNRIANLFRGITNPKQFENNLQNGVYDLPTKNAGSRSENLTDNDYKQLCIILNSFVRKDGSIDAESLQTFLELGCTDGNLMFIEGVSDYSTDCGSVLQELSKYARKENSIISIGLESMPESEMKIPKSIMLVNNIVIATATAKPTPQGHYYDLHPAPKPIVIQQPYNPVGAVVNPSSVQPVVVGYEEPEPYKPQKRINITLKKNTIAEGNISVWSVGDFATVYEYSGDATDILKNIRSKYINYAKQKANEKVDTLKVSVPKSAFDITDGGTFRDSAGTVLDIIGCFPVASEVISVLSLSNDAVSLYNDGLVHEAFDLDSPEIEAAYEQHKQVESIKSDISKIFSDFSKRIDEIDKLSAKLEYSGAYFSAIYYNKSGSVSLPDYNISTDDLIRYVRVYNQKAIAINSSIADDSSKLPVLNEQKITSGDLSEFKQYISIYLDTLSKGDLLDDIK